MGIVTVIQAAVVSEISNLYNIQADASKIQVTETKQEFDGDYTVVLFALTKELKRSPESIGNELGEALTASNPDLFPSFNVIKGFLNISLGDNYWLEFLEEHHHNPFYGFAEPNSQRIMVEYSSDYYAVRYH